MDFSPPTRRFFLAALVVCFPPVVQAASQTRHYAYNEIAVDVPFDGGGILSFSRFWTISPKFDAGVIVAAGVVERDFKIDKPGGGEYDASTQAQILPFIGPRLSFSNNYLGLSIGWGLFHARTEFEVDGPTGKLTSTTSDWGTALYAPLLVLDFYNKKYDMIFGFGLGSFLGTSYPTLEAESGGTQVSSDASPLTTLTLHLRTRWKSARTKKAMEDEQDEYWK